MKAIVAVLLLGIAVARASPTSGTCVLDVLPAAGPKESIKSCSKCQWQCLTDDHCRGLTFDGVSYTKEELAAVGDCGDGYFVDPTLSRGICVLFDANSNFEAFVFDTQEQDCAECAQQCNTDSRCTSFIYNGVSYNKGQNCPGLPRPSPVPVVPSPVPVVPSPVPVIPSPVPVIPSPVPVVPSPVPVIPSPIPPPPSPAVVPPTAGIVVRPGVCNYDIIKYEVTVIERKIILDSDECCELCANSTVPCNVASFCFDSESNAGCGPDGSIPRFTCELGFASLGTDGFPSAVIPKESPEAKGWVTVTVTPANVPELFSG